MRDDPIMKTATGPRLRLTGKDGRNKNAAELFRLLLVFAVTAWVEMTERWYNMPENPTRNLPMVCNLHPLELRAMGALVWDEHKYSSRPLYEHLCAACGQLLHSRTEHSHLPREMGLPGPACQLRGRVASWHALPLFLLLWSKKRLGHYLRSICTYDAETNKLTLSGGWETAPWLHYKPNTTRLDVRTALYGPRLF
jgi:hypothetical protein